MSARSIEYRRGRSGRPLERAKARVYAEETHCCRCGELVDKSLPYRDPITGRVNRMSKSFEHLTELDRGTGDPYDGHLAHLACNSSAGAKYGNDKRRVTDDKLVAGVDDSLG